MNDSTERPGAYQPVPVTCVVGYVLRQREWAERGAECLDREKGCPHPTTCTIKHRGPAGGRLNAASRQKLFGVHPSLVAVVTLASEMSTQPFVVTCGVRTPAEQAALYAQGRTKPGQIVTWTLNSRHFKAADGYGHAVDLAPLPIDWDTPAKFDAISKAMFAAAADLGVELRWGADWDRDGQPRERGETDSPHFEI